MKVASCTLALLLISFLSASATYSVFQENGKAGLKDDQGRIVIPAQYDALGWSNGSFSVVDNVTGYKLSGRWGLISTGNHRVTKNEYDELIPAESQLFIAKKNSSYSLRIVTGCISLSGKEAIPFEYDGIKISSLRAVVFTKIGNQYKYGVIDLANHTIIPQQYQNIYPIGSLRFAVENFENKLALFSETGKQVTDFTIDKISPFTKNYAIIYQGMQQGVMDRDGQIKIQPGYQSIAILEDGTLKVRAPHTWEFLDGRNKLIMKHEADSIEPVDKNLIKVKRGEAVLLTDQQLKPVSPNTFTSIGRFTGNKAIMTVNRKYGVINRAGTIIIQPLYDTLIPARQYIVASQRQTGKSTWLLLDSIGTRLNTKSYEHLEPLQDHYLTAYNRGFAGAIDSKGREVIACVYDSLLQLAHGLIVVKFHKQYGIINLKEEWVVTPRANKLTILTENRYMEETPQRKFLKATGGNVIYFTDNPIKVSSDYILEYLPSGTIWKIDLDGRIADRQVHPDEPIEKIYEESEGLRAIRKNGKYGFIDSQGRLRIANRYEGVQKFSESLAPAMIRGHWGYINHQDQIAIQPAYDEVTAFQNGVAFVRQKQSWGTIDKSGKVLLPIRYQRVTLLPTKNFLIQTNDLEGLADATGKILILPRFHKLEDAGNGFAIVERDGKYGVINLQGISTIPLMYDFIQYDRYNDFFIAQKKSLWTNFKN
ncbi:MAG TPA: WG repeat-containing protein [Ohtaekwangia sp.]|uniref:WG repeat-containing protein n=1 Tax=Ohtaekwangia sp. TaxID=2066019 RepID=UPI002F923CE6